MNLPHERYPMARNFNSSKQLWPMPVDPGSLATLVGHFTLLYRHSFKLHFSFMHPFTYFWGKSAGKNVNNNKPLMWKQKCQMRQKLKGLVPVNNWKQKFAAVYNNPLHLEPSLGDKKKMIYMNGPKQLCVWFFFLSATIHLYNPLYPNLERREPKEAMEGTSGYTDSTRPLYNLLYSNLGHPLFSNLGRGERKEAVEGTSRYTDSTRPQYVSLGIIIGFNWCMINQVLIVI